MINGATELGAYQRGHGQSRGPVGAIAAFAADARLLTNTLGEAFEDWRGLLEHVGIDPEARSGARSFPEANGTGSQSAGLVRQLREPGPEPLEPGL